MNRTQTGSLADAVSSSIKVPAVSPRKLVASASFTDAKVASLKILAMTLLKEIESLENCSSSEAQPLNLQNEVHRFEAAMIESALTRTGGRQRRAARLLGVKVTTLNTKIKRHRIGVGPRTRPDDPHNGTMIENQTEVVV